MNDYYTFQNIKVQADEKTVMIRPAEGNLRRLPVEQVSGLHRLAGYAITDGLVNLANRARLAKCGSLREFLAHAYEALNPGACHRLRS